MPRSDAQPRLETVGSEQPRQRVPGTVTDPGYSKAYVTRLAPHGESFDRIPQTVVGLEEVLCGLSIEDSRPHGALLDPLGLSRPGGRRAPSALRSGPFQTPMAMMFPGFHRTQVDSPIGGSSRGIRFHRYSFPYSSSSWRCTRSLTWCHHHGLLCQRSNRRPSSAQ